MADDPLRGLRALRLRCESELRRLIAVASAGGATTQEIADAIGVSTTNVDFWLTPWRRVDEHLPLTHIAEVTHSRGFFWDAISVESSGGLNPLRVFGVAKPAARAFVEHVRERLNEVGPVVTQAQPVRRPPLWGRPANEVSQEGGS